MVWSAGRHSILALTCSMHTHNLQLQIDALSPCAQCFYALWINDCPDLCYTTIDIELTCKLLGIQSEKLVLL